MRVNSWTPSRTWLVGAAIGVVVLLVSTSTALEGCQSVTTTSTTQTPTTTTTYTSVTKTTTQCCREERSQCLACEAKMQQSEFCGNRSNYAVKGCPACGLVEEGYDYPGGMLRKVWGHWDYNGCCAECRKEQLCTSWTWDSSARVCYLRNQIVFKRERKHGHTSGLPGGDSVGVQIRSGNGKCLIHEEEILHVADCNGQPPQSLWDYDLRTRVLSSRDGMCLTKSATVDKAQLAPCSSANAKAGWAFDGTAGGLRLDEGKLEDHSSSEWMAVHELCLSAPTIDLRPCALSLKQQFWDIWPSSSAPTQSLFCFSVLLPWTHEQVMLEFQRESSYGIFGCEAASVYSNDTYRLGGEVSTKRVHALEWNGRFANGKVAWQKYAFIEIWKHVIEECIYLKHDWTVKVDPEAVFLANRFRHQVRHLHYGYNDALGGSSYDNGVFLNNCPFGMRRPLLVVSRRALVVYASSAKKCEPHTFETAYLKNCFLGLDIVQLDEFQLLADGECHKGEFSNHPHWQTCRGDQVAFHPFITPDVYTKCITAARQTTY